jgi:organic hydroperoxide reductase OsmC/OhrA
MRAAKFSSDPIQKPKGTTISQAATAPGEKLLYTGRAHTQGGRDHGIARSDDGQLEVKFSPPGSGRPGTNPEQMLAAGWSACFEGALDISGA